MPCAVLADGIVEIGALGGPEVFVIEGRDDSRATHGQRGDGEKAYVVFRGEAGTGGECRVEIGDEDDGNDGNRSRLLETYICNGNVIGRYSYNTVKKALLALKTGTKVSLRIDGNGVLSLQILIEVNTLLGGGNGQEGKEDVTFVDFRMAPLFEEGYHDGDGETNSRDDDSE